MRLLRMAVIDNYSLTDRYTIDEGRVFLTGVQALARIPAQQLRIDRVNGLNTAAFISGYPGSPLGGFDQEAARAAATAPELPIVCQPGVNEELGATAVMGSQLAAEQPDFKYDGVLGIWYGKAPGLDRAGDALRHAAFAGTSRYGGAIALVGDDPAAKSSTLPSSSDATIYDLHMPLFYPGDVQETIDLSRHAVALSRMTGMWTAMKIVAAVADGSGTVDVAINRVEPIIPDLTIPGDPDGRTYEPHPNGNLLTPYTLDLERDFRETRLILAQRYATANRLNHPTTDPTDAWIGLIASGYTYHELLEALRRLGLGSLAAIEAVGIRLMHVQMPLSIDPANISKFAHGLDEIVVVEEKNPTLEWLVKDALYGGPNQPLVLGKKHEDGRTLMRNHNILDAGAILGGLRERLATRLESSLAPLPQPPRERLRIPLTVNRTPYFCSGCPHNRSTKVNDDALVGAGIGCHGMVLLMDEEKVGELAGITAMGGEGVQWIGMSPFVERDHFVQNLGDGTYFHSGQLAIQASIAGGVNATYKLLYNGTVAMTGGQNAVGGVGVPEIATALLAHGVAEVLITTDDVDRYTGTSLPTGPTGAVEVWDRSRVLEAQTRLAAISGVTVLIHDQACAAQTRRLRKRGQAATPKEKIAINPRICEACGDCGEVSNCLSVQPINTPFGVKTTIDQSSCNLDASCVEGDCPSFLTIEQRDPAKIKRKKSVPTAPKVEDPTLVVSPDSLDLRMVGIGGTGVVTVAQVIATAAMLDGFHVRGLDQTGLSQKAGRVTGDLRLTRGEPAPSNLIGSGGADVLLAFDLLGSVAALDVADPNRTILIASSSTTPTGSMVGRPDLAYPELPELLDRLDDHTRSDVRRLVDAAGICVDLLGATTAANIFLLGVAVQAGVIPIAPDRIEEAISLNGVAVEANLAALAHGRAWQESDQTEPAIPDHPETQEQLIDLLASDLVEYQNRAYADRFKTMVERATAYGDDNFAENVARSYHKLLAYKDEYEVARLLLGPESQALVNEIGGPGATVRWKLHPPILKSLGMNRKLTISARAGGPAMRLLRRSKRLRGTPLDPFGRAEVRKTERSLITEFETAMETVFARLDDESLSTQQASTIAALALDIRGYEERKLERVAEFRAAMADALG